MSDDLEEESITTRADFIKKLIIWAVVIGVSLMLILVVIFQPRFFTFVQ